MWYINRGQSVSSISVMCAGLVVLAAGCKSERKLKTHVVRGTVVYKGSNLPATKFEGGDVVLDPVTGPGKMTVVGTIKEDGTFALGSVIDGKGIPGVPTGEYRVRIVPAPNDATGRANRRLIHPKYMSFESSGLRLLITGDMTDVTLEVEGPK